MRAAPRGTPDPDGDRRFAERPFPLLEPVEWTGERHRWGYGTREPTGITTSLGLVFGPWDRFTTEPRLAVTIGSEFPIAVTDEDAPLLFRHHFVGDRAEPARGTATVEIVSTDVELDVLRAGDRWLGLGVWRGFAVELDAIAIEPGDVRLRIAGEIPDR